MSFYPLHGRVAVPRVTTPKRPKAASSFPMPHRKAGEGRDCRRALSSARRESLILITTAPALYGGG